MPSLTKSLVAELVHEAARHHNSQLDHRLVVSDHNLLAFLNSLCGPMSEVLLDVPLSSIVGTQRPESPRVS